MKVYMSPIEMIAWFDYVGTPRPVKFRWEDKEFRVEQILSMAEEKLAGNKMKIYRCQSEINGELKRFELKFELNTCKWYIYKI